MLEYLLKGGEGVNFIEIEYRERSDSWGMSELQSHDYYELYFLLRGNRSFFCGNKMFNISERAFCVIPPFSMHKTSGGGYARINVNVSPDLLYDWERELLGNLAKSTAFSLEYEGAELIIALLCEAAELSIVDAQKKQRISASFLHTLLHLIAKRSPPPLGHNARVETAAEDTLILEVVSYLNRCYRDELTLDTISERFYISKNALCARFRAAMNCSVMQYLAFVRLSRAKELLATTDKSMDEISALCGYSSPNYFSLIFKKSVGISPREYKKTK